MPASLGFLNERHTRVCVCVCVLIRLSVSAERGRCSLTPHHCGPTLSAHLHWEHQETSAQPPATTPPPQHHAQLLPPVVKRIIVRGETSPTRYKRRRVVRDPYPRLIRQLKRITHVRLGAVDLPERREHGSCERSGRGPPRTRARVPACVNLTGDSRVPRPSQWSCNQSELMVPVHL